MFPSGQKQNGAVLVISQAAKDTAKKIGDDSFELLNFGNLPDSASENRQRNALKRDRDWQTDHHNEIVARIDYLISNILRGLQ